MKTGFVQPMAILVALAAMAGTAPCLGQDLNIEIPVPEPSIRAPASKEVGKRKHAPRVSDSAEKRQTVRPSPAEPRPSVEPSLGEEPPTDLGALPERTESSSPPSKFPRGWLDSGTDAAARREPSWGNPAGIPLRARPLGEPEAVASSRNKANAAEAPPRAAKNRAEVKEPSGRGAWLSRWFQGGRREGSPAEPPKVARRHRASNTHDSAKELAPPFFVKPRLPDPLDLDSVIKLQRD